MNNIGRQINIDENNPLNMCVMLPYIQPAIDICKTTAANLPVVKATTIAAKELVDRCASETYSACLESLKNHVYGEGLSSDENARMRKTNCLVITADSCKKYFEDFMNEFQNELTQGSLILLASTVCVVATAVICYRSINRRPHV